jgi:uncharacterized damage-inducible protein DinB
LISPDHVRLLARYNIWQNKSLIEAASTLSDAERSADRGAFFRSIHGTFSHVLWGDRMWMHRFSSSPKPDGGIAQSAVHVTDWNDLVGQRKNMDGDIQNWANEVSAEWLAGSTTWVSSAAKQEFTRKRWHLVAHMFNHQTHHRGQIHAMLTAAGAKPDDTDLMLLDSV